MYLAQADNASIGNITGVVNDSSVAAIQDNILILILNPILGLATAIAFVLFLWGLVRFLINRTTNPDETAKGKTHIIAGLSAIFILVSVWSILGFIGKGLNSNVWFIN
jgi:hypothetical protein